MSKKVLVISTSVRPRSNSETLARAFARGAEEAGNEVEFISLKGKKLAFCTGCVACRKLGHCAIPDDTLPITESVRSADVVAFATPIYFYEMCGQMKVLLDRFNPLFGQECAVRDVYLLTTATEKEEWVTKGAEQGLLGWIKCRPGSRLVKTFFCGGVAGPGAIEGDPKLDEAYELGKSV